MTDLDTDRSLLGSHRRKLVMGVPVLAFSAILVLFPETVSELIGVSSWPIALAGAVIFFVLLYWLAYGLRCPSCRVNLFWYGLGHAKSGSWLDWIFKQSVCPKCGYRATGKSASTDQRS
jgi:hypothetical protein